MKAQATDAQAIFPTSRRKMPQMLAFFRAVVVLGLVFIGLISPGYFSDLTSTFTPDDDNPFEHLRAHCAHSKPISAQSLSIDRLRLLESCMKTGLEPISPVVDDENHGNVRARVSVLAPKFEEDRARLLGIPSMDPIEYVTWAEEKTHEAIRLFVSEGLKDAGRGRLDVKMAPRSIRALRERKGPEELALMRCANEVTLLAIRAVRERMYIGIRESTVGQMMSLALGTAGLQNTFALVQFGENAALPHGSGSDRVLRADDMVLIDTGGSLHHYESDVTRTFALPDSVIPGEHVRIWETVSKVQAHAFSVARKGVEARAVDEAARAYMDDQQAGMSRYFSHRLGHGIGLEGHEAPYLRRGADNTHRLEAGNAMSDEPGIYMLGKVGVRLEDCFYISEIGEAVLLTSGVGGFARDLLHP
ncbi:Metallopeptidase family M24 [Ceratobasidium sp. AG-Ba]|nr:Metallopeptidase family M24 [Ceratobasidium sp. AG-Ba]